MASSRTSTPCSSTTLPPDSTLVERQLLALQDVTVAAAALTRAGRDDSVQPTRLELPLDRRLDLAGSLEPLGLLRLNTLALLHLFCLLRLLLASAADGLTIVRLVPLPERRSIDLHNGGLGEGVRADQLVVRGVEGDGDDTDLAGDALTAPGEVAGVEAQGAELAVAAAGADKVDAFAADTGVGGLAALLESSALSSSSEWWVLRMRTRSAFRFMHTSSCGSMRA